MNSIDISASIYFETCDSDQYRNSQILQDCCNRLETNDVDSEFYIKDMASSWKFSRGWQLVTSFNFKINSKVYIPNYYEINFSNLRQNPDYQFNKTNIDSSLPLFLILFFSTKYFVPFYIEDVKIKNLTEKDIDISYKYLLTNYQDKESFCFLINYLRSDSFSKWKEEVYTLTNSKYEPLLVSLINQHSVQFSHSPINKKEITSSKRSIKII